jgi:hypothetical protein
VTSGDASGKFGESKRCSQRVPVPAPKIRQLADDNLGQGNDIDKHGSTPATISPGGPTGGWPGSPRPPLRGPVRPAEPPGRLRCLPRRLTGSWGLQGQPGGHGRVSLPGHHHVGGTGRAIMTAHQHMGGTSRTTRDADGGMGT